jgi:hypothetical protein
MVKIIASVWRQALLLLQHMRHPSRWKGAGYIVLIFYKIYYTVRVGAPGVTMQEKASFNQWPHITNIVPRLAPSCFDVSINPKRARAPHPAPLMQTA